jgi:hypothetical protein
LDKCIRCNKPLADERRVPPFGEKKVFASSAPGP